jgi:DNA-binding Lrp family transcriptional regulator
MPKKKLSTAKEKYDYLMKRYYSDIVSGVKTKKNLLFERSLHAILELQECEEVYLKDKKTDIDFEFFHIQLEDSEKYDGITNESKKEFLELKINDDQISSADFEWIGEAYIKEKEDKDNSEISASPLFDMYVKNKFTNRILGIKFIIKSQMGYNIHFAETDIRNLKKLQKDINEIITKIENEKKTYIVIGCGPLYKFESTGDFYEFPKEAKDRTEILKNDHGLHKNFKVVKVERNNIGDETWHVEGFEEENSELFKIKIQGYPCDFTFVAKQPFKNNFKKTEFDEERQKFLISKMKKLKLPNSGHAYEDFVIEYVKKVKGGEEWILGS